MFSINDLTRDENNNGYILLTDTLYILVRTKSVQNGSISNLHDPGRPLNALQYYGC
jgi:hypothetical protein